MNLKQKVNIIDSVKNRFSTVTFSDQEVEEEKIIQLIEAARWAPSSYNSQPWKFVIGIKGTNIYNIILNNLVEKNKEWAKFAPVLIVGLTELFFAHNGKENKYAFHDLGMAVGNMLNQATAIDLFAHQMGGFKANELRKELNIPEKLGLGSVIAIGYKGDISDFSDELQKRENAERTRKAIDEILIKDRFPK